MTTTATIEPRTKIVGANHTDVQISANPWNQPRIVAGGSQGGLFARDTVQADGWGLIAAVAVGQVLASAGVNTVPVWSSSPTLTAITVTTINTPGGASDIGSSSTPFRSGYFSTSIAVGPTPASTGAIRLSNNQGVYVRNAVNTADILVLNVDGANALTIGNSGATQTGLTAGASFASIGVSGSGSLPFTWTLNSSGHFVPQNNNAFDVGDSTHRARVVYANQIGASGSAITDLFLSGAIKWGTSASVPALRNSGAELQAILADVSDYATFRAKTMLATGSVQVTATTGFVAIGTPAATQGAIRLQNDGYIWARNPTNTGDVLVLGTYQDTVFTTSSNIPYLVPGSGDGSASLGKATNRWAHGYFSGYVSIGDGITAPGPLAGAARIYVDTADGDLKVVFGDGVVKTIVLDT